MNINHLLQKLLLSLILIFVFTIVHSQDISFDQYHKAPTYLNPALTGVINGNYRINALYHSQWAGQLETGINAFYAGGDVKFERNGTKGKIDFVGLGLTFLNDEYNEYNLSTRTLSINTSYHKQLDAKYNQYLGLGLQLSINQKNLDYANLNFEDQFNQLDGYTLPTGEFLPQNNYGYFDFSTGLFYSIQATKDLYINFGTSYGHINTPNVSYYKNVKNPVSSLVQKSLLQSKWNIHSSASIKMSERVSLIPDLLFQKQGLHQNIILGTRLKLNLNYEDPNNSVSVGLRGKISKNQDNSNFSSLMFVSDYKIKNLILGFSYNVLLEPAVSDRLAFNIFEFSLKYTGVYNNDNYHCPEF